MCCSRAAFGSWSPARWRRTRRWPSTSDAHGDGVRDVCFVGRRRPRPPTPPPCARGARPERPPEHRRRRARRGVPRRRRRRTARRSTRSSTAPATRPASPPASAHRPSHRPRAGRSGSTHIDHIVANVEQGHLDEWVGYYEEVFGLRADASTSTTKRSPPSTRRCMSTVVWNGADVVLPINEPADGRRKSQIEEYLDYYRSPGRAAPGARHRRHRGHRGARCGSVACGCSTCRPSTTTRRPASAWPASTCRGRSSPSSGILVDRDEQGHLLQVFTENVCDRPTVFFEVIQREGPRVRRGQLQGPVRVDRTGTGRSRQPLALVGV